ncbi:hypothetical protein NIA69_20670 [Gemmiger formicilis]|nr:hypothetical protein [Gemmiger formicilis]
MRGCSQIQFRRDIPGSKKIYPFYIEAAANADTVEVYEAPIDAMSGASLKIMQHTKIGAAFTIWRWAVRITLHWMRFLHTTRT